MKINSAIRAMFGVATALGAAAAALPASAATVTFNASTGAATGVGELKVNNINGTFTVQCLTIHDFSLASGISTGVAYTIPPAEVLVEATSYTSLPGGTSYCNTSTEVGLPWAIEFNSITSTTSANVTIDGMEFYNPSIGSCGPTDVSGTLVITGTATVLKIPPFTMSATPTGNCSSSSTISLTISAAAAPYLTLTYP